MINKKLVIVSGLSGAGKSQVLNILEDNDYFCVDNLPVELIHKFIDLFKNSKRTKFAIGLDIRSAENIGDLKKAFNIISFKNKNVSVLKLFLDSDDMKLCSQYVENQSNFYVQWDELGKIYDGSEWITKHIELILKLDLILIEKIRNRKFKIVLIA